MAIISSTTPVIFNGQNAEGAVIITADAVNNPNLATTELITTTLYFIDGVLVNNPIDRTPSTYTVPDATYDVKYIFDALENIPCYGFCPTKYIWDLTAGGNIDFNDDLYVGPLQSFAGITAADLQSQITALNAQITALQATTTTAANSNATLSTSNTELNNQVGTLTTSNTTLQTQVATLTVQNTTLEEENTTLSTLLGTCQTSLDTATNQIEDLETQVTSLTVTMTNSQIQDTIDNIVNCGNGISGIRGQSINFYDPSARSGVTSAAAATGRTVDPVSSLFGSDTRNCFKKVERKSIRPGSSLSQNNSCGDSTTKSSDDKRLLDIIQNTKKNCAKPKSLKMVNKGTTGVPNTGKVCDPTNPSHFVHTNPSTKDISTC